MPNIKVDTAALEETAERLLAGRDFMDSKLVELIGLVHNLTANGFQAQHTSAAYNEMFEQFTSGTRRALEGLEHLSKFLVRVVDTFEKTDSDLAKAVKPSPLDLVL
jgi:uncharacterized protein YukE